MTAKPLTNEELREIQICDSETFITTQWERRLLATIRRRDELIRDAAGYSDGRIEARAERGDKNATEILEIVEVGDG